MTDESQEGVQTPQLSKMLLKQNVTGSRKTSNYLIGSMVSIGGVGFLLADIVRSQWLGGKACSSFNRFPSIF